MPISTYTVTTTNINHAIAHEAVYRLKNVLHRDISNGNILIAKVPGKKGEVEGLLIDWDLCVNVAQVSAEHRKGSTVRVSLCSTAT